MSIVDALPFALDSVDKFAQEIGQQGHSSDANDPLTELRQKREMIEREPSGLRGASNWLYGKIGLEPKYDSEIGKFSDAEYSYERQTQEINQSQTITAQEAQEAQWHYQAQMANVPAAQRDQANIDAEYRMRLYEAGMIHGDPKREAQVRADAFAIKVAQEGKLDEQSGLEYANLQTGIRAAQLNLAGDPQAAQREQFDQEQANQRVALTQKYGESSDQVKAFDQKSALERQELTKKQATERQEMESQSARAIADIQGEAHEAQLRAAGSTYEADRDQFLRTGQDRVDALKEQANSADDARRKSLLLAQADAQEKANAQEIAAMDQAHQRQQDSPPAPSVPTPTQSSTLQDYRQKAAQGAQFETLENYSAAPEKSATAQVVELGAMLNHENEHGQAHPTKQAADRANAAARIRDFVAQAHNAGAGRILSAQQYADGLGASVLYGAGTGQALGMASADLKTLGKGGSLSSDLSSVGQKLSNAADKWNHIADQMRNVTILTMGR